MEEGENSEEALVGLGRYIYFFEVKEARVYFSRALRYSVLCVFSS